MFTCCKTQENVVILNRGTEDELKCEGYQKCSWKAALYVILCIFSLGLVWLLCRWIVRWKVHLTSTRCSMKKADLVLLEDDAGNVYVEEVHCDVIGSPRGLRDYSTFNQKGSNAPTEGSVNLPPPDGQGYVADGARKRSKESPIVESEQKCIVRYIDHHHLRYAWNEASNSFEMLCGLEKDTTCKDIVEKYTGFNSAARINRLTLYGMNQLVIDVSSYCSLLFHEVLNPFYIFQVFSIVLWSLENYYIYAACIFVISAISLTIELCETRKQQVTLRNTVMTDDIMINVFVPGSQDTIEVASSLLVPGDMIHIPCQAFTMPCDVALVSGSVVVDEGMLTGESIPVTKTHLSEEYYSDIYSPISHKKNTVFCGTKVLQARFYGNAKVKAVVVRTGYSTMKGELVRMILYPKPIKFSFYRDALMFVFFLAIVATAGFIFTFTFLTIHKFSLLSLIPKALDVITIAVPPALPAAMTVGIIYAQRRLKKQQIFCVGPQRINLCGKINCMCFDKTGTLTEDGLDLWGVIPVDRIGVTFREPIRDPKSMPTDDPFVVGMATCHSLTHIGGEVCGDPLDHKMFESTGWLLEEPGGGVQMFDNIVPAVVKPISMETYMLDSDKEQHRLSSGVAILRQFTFDSALQRMSVVVRMTSSDHMTVFIKGSPEKITSICNPSTVPDNYTEILRKHASKGYRVIAMATKDLEKSISWHHVQRLSRDSVEDNLNFLGLLILENKLKPETIPVLRNLNEADIKTVMITGDNILTAVCVARQCYIVAPGVKVIQVEAMPPENGRRARITWQVDEDQLGTIQETDHLEPMIRLEPSFEVNKDHEVILLDESQTCDHDNYQLSITGRSYSVLCQYFPELLQKVVAKAAIFARMTPDQKTSVIENLQDLGLTVGMCGDGANDCGALRTSHAGISLSQMEASVASPFTSKVDDISCVPLIIREGRGSLVTSFGVFKFMALYSIIQFASVIILTARFSKLTDPMFLYIDLFIITVLALTMGRTEPSAILSKEKPRSRLASASNLSGIGIHVIIVIVFQLAVMFYVMNQSWFILKAEKDLEIPSFEMTCVFSISLFQYLATALVFSKGPPFRRRIWTNYWFSASLLILTIANIIIIISPGNVFSYIFRGKELPNMTFKVIIIIIAFGNILLTALFEEMIFESSLFNTICNKIFCAPNRPSLYKDLLVELEDSSDWPPVGQVTWSDVAAGQARLRLPSS